MDSSGGPEAKGGEGDSGFRDTYTILPLPTTQTLVSPQHDDISSSKGDSQPQDDNISQSSEEGDLQSSEKGGSQSQNNNSQSPQPDVSHPQNRSRGIYAPISACNNMFPIHLVGVIQRSSSHGDILVVAVSITFPRSELLVFLRINITLEKVQLVAWGLFRACFEDKGRSCCIYIKHK